MSVSFDYHEEYATKRNAVIGVVTLNHTPILSHDFGAYSGMDKDSRCRYALNEVAERLAKLLEMEIPE